MKIMQMLMLSGLLVMVHGLCAVEANMAKRGNVRFGPSTKDGGIVCTLNAGTSVEILGKAEGSNNWYKIKFPAAGVAWMHSMNLAKTDQERVLRVTQDGANVRRDATSGSKEVIKLNRNDTVRWKGPKVGQWYAVYVPTAVAYVHTSVLHIKDENEKKVDAEPAAADPQAEAKPNNKITSGPLTNDKHASHPTDKVWRSALATYEDYYQQLQKDSGKALHLDWDGLSAQLKQVTQDHPELRTRVLAERLRRGITRVVNSAGSEKAPSISEGTKPKTEVAVKKDPEPTATETKTDPVVKTDPVPADTEKKPDIAVIAKTDKGVQGWVDELEVPAIGVKFVLLGDNGISAFIKLKDGLKTNLKDLHWQTVRVDGETQIVDHEVDAKYKGIPLIIVSELKVVK